MQWTIPASPQLLPELLRRLPRSNGMHITHSVPFTAPEVELSDVNLSALAATNKASPLSAVLS